MTVHLALVPFVNCIDSLTASGAVTDAPAKEGEACSLGAMYDSVLELVLHPMSVYRLRPYVSQVNKMDFLSHFTSTMILSPRNC